MNEISGPSKQREYYRPPAPVPRSIFWTVWRILFSRRSDVLHYLPSGAYTAMMSPVKFARGRTMFHVNDPKVIREIMIDKVDDYPKSDVLTSSLAPLVGDSIFTVSGETWKRQHRMIDQVFQKLRLKIAFEAMQEAMREYVARLDARIDGTVNLDEEMAFVTADVIFRTMFSRPIADEYANIIFTEFNTYQETLPHTRGWDMFTRGVNDAPKVPRKGQKACDRIREIIEVIVDERLSGKVEHDDICQIICTCTDPETGKPFTRLEMVNQIAFFFLAGHETSASALTWTLLCLSQDDYAASRVRREVLELSNNDEIQYETINRMKFTSAAFKEGLRLYPPVSFMPRIALKEDYLRGHYDIKPDDLMVISPWTVQRHEKMWKNPDRFVPERFENDRSGGGPNGAWIPFSVGQRVCTGAAFANAESTLVIGTLLRRYKFTPINPDRIEPVSRLTVRPRKRIKTKVELL